MFRSRPSKSRPTRLARPQTLMMINRNYARRIETIFSKAAGAPMTVDEAQKDNCRIAVIQEFNGVKLMFTTHKDSEWPPSREALQVCIVLIYS